MHQLIHSSRSSLLWLLCGVLLAWQNTHAAGPDRAEPAAPRAPASEAKVFVAIYKRGPAYQTDKGLFQQRGVREHVQHHEALGERLIAAGPLRAEGDDEPVGIVVFLAESAAGAEQWLQGDPAVAQGVLSARVRQWGISEVRAYRRD